MPVGRPKPDTDLQRNPEDEEEGCNKEKKEKKHRHNKKHKHDKKGKHK